MMVKINSKGLRDREIDYTKERNTYRIGIFGDSFTFGEGVQNNETYSKLLENILNADEELKLLGKKIEVLNFGIGKTGTSHQYAFYQKEGKKYDLDLVILGFLAGNDFNDNITGVFILKNNELVHNPTTYSSIRNLQKIVYYLPFYKWLTAHSHLSNFVRVEMTILDDRWRAEKSFGANVESNLEAKLDGLKISITKKLLVEFSRELKQDGVGMLLVQLPEKKQKPFSDYSSKNETPPDYVVFSNILDREIKESQLRLQKVDLVPLFSRLPSQPYYFQNDGHMTSLGHQLIAFEIHRYLKPRLYEELKSRAQKRK
jgi:lysophospholipase L1-like esterase